MLNEFKDTNDMEKRDLLRSFKTQFDPEISPLLQRTTCGIASLYTGLRYLGHDVGKYPDFVKKYVEHGSFNVPTYFTDLKIGDTTAKVPIIYFPNSTNESEERRLTNESLSDFRNLSPSIAISRSYTPEQNQQRAFTLAYGFDHRGIQTFLKDDLNLDNIDVRLVEGEDLPSTLSDNSVILASVKQSALGYPARLMVPKSSISTHVITITGIGELGSENTVLFTDPAYLDTRDGIQVRTLDAVNSAMAGKYTVITDLS